MWTNVWFENLGFCLKLIDLKDDECKAFKVQALQVQEKKKNVNQSDKPINWGASSANEPFFCESNSINNIRGVLIIYLLKKIIYLLCPYSISN